MGHNKKKQYPHYGIIKGDKGTESVFKVILDENLSVGEDRNDHPSLCTQKDPK